MNENREPMTLDELSKHYGFDKQIIIDIFKSVINDKMSEHIDSAGRIHKKALKIPRFINGYREILHERIDKL